MKKIKSLIEKAEKSYIRHCGHCADVLHAIEHMLPNDKDYEFDVFMQAGDGLCISDVNYHNYPVNYIITLYNKEKRRLDYGDLIECAI